jgi:SAM-dependent methyltransferase
MRDRDTFASGAAYEPYVGRWSRRVAVEFLDWLDAEPGGDWLDVGCGTGALTETILAEARPASVVGIDPAQGYIDYAREHVRDRRAAFKSGDATPLPFEAKQFDAVVSGLALNFIPRPDLAVSEMARFTLRGGIVAAYVWDYAGGMQMLRVFWDAAIEADRTLADEDEGRRFPMCQPGPLTQMWHTAGLDRVEVRPIDVTTHFRDFDDYWLPFLGGQGPAAGYVTTLAEDSRAALRERIRSRLPVSADGSISLAARAWAVRGQR